MNKIKAIELINTLLSHYDSEWEGTEFWPENHKEFADTIDYIKKNL